METGNKYQLFVNTFNKKKELSKEEILRISSILKLNVLEKDIRNNIGFLSRFSVAYPKDTTTSNQFSLLLIFFAIRHTQGLKEADSEHMEHLRKIHFSLKNNTQLSPAQIDLWKWFSKKNQ